MLSWKTIYLKLCSSSVAKTVSVIILIEIIGLQYAMYESNRKQPNNVVVTSSPKTLRSDTLDGVKQELQANYMRQFNITNKDRVTRLSAYCHHHKNRIIKNYPDYNLKPDGLAEWVWIVSEQHNLFYCSVPKCGSTKWKGYILHDIGIHWKSGDIHETARILGARHFVKAMGIDQAMYLDKSRLANRMIIVRNPWTRIVSAYRDIQVYHLPMKNVCYGWKALKGVKNPTFRQFVDCLIAKPANVHYQSTTHPITGLCGVCRMNYNIIMKVEDLDESRNYLTHRLNFRNKTDNFPPPVNKVNTYSSYYEQLTSTQIEKLKEIYYYDIKLFDYPLDPLV